MIVERNMQRQLVTITPQGTIGEALELMRVHAIHHLPVVEGKTLLGVLTDRDLRMALMPLNSNSHEKEIYFLTKEISVQEIMTTRIITASPDMYIEDAARLMRNHSIGCLPVVEHDELVGIITESDILDVFIEMMRIISGSERIDLILGNRRGAFEDVSATISQEGGEVLSVGMSPDEDLERRIYYFRIKGKNLAAIVGALKRKQYKVISTYS